MNCPNCQQQLADFSNFCFACGQTLRQQPPPTIPAPAPAPAPTPASTPAPAPAPAMFTTFCIKCGMPYAADQQFCVRCGNRRD